MDNGGTDRGPPVRSTIMIVEDEWLIAMDIAEAVQDSGFKVAGPAHTVATALELLASTQVDGGLLDVNLRGETSYPVAEALAERRIPFAFLSGYASSQLRTCYQSHPILSKPVDQKTLRHHLTLMLRSP